MKKTFRSFTIAVLVVLSVLAFSNGPPTSAANPWIEEGGTTKVFFSTSSPQITEWTNLYWTIYGVQEHPDPDIQSVTSRFGDSTWSEWSSMKFSWTDHNNYRGNVRQNLLRSYKVNGFNAFGEQPDGYVWSWGSQERWPDGSYHFDQIPRFVNAVYNTYMWTMDDQYLSKVLPKAELIMDNYLLDHMEGIKGMLTIQEADNDGTVNGKPSNYWDQARFGYQDAWINAAFYTSLLNMVELQLVQGNTEKAEHYQTLAEAFPVHYDNIFWNDNTNRYIGWRDVDGEAHDFGFTYINTEALTRGLGDESKAYLIYEWLNSANAQPAIGGAHPGSTDVYQLIVAPRTNTEDIPEEYNDPWSNPSTGERPYGEGLPDGGAAMWTSYYDIMARLQYFGADNAFDRFEQMIRRVASDSKYLTFNPNEGRFYNDFGESLVEVGTNHPFPESGIALLPLVHGFIGANADRNGLHIEPNLPNALLYAEAAKMNYAGHPLTVQVSRGDITLGNELYDSPISAGPNHSATQVFTAPESFDEIGVYVEPSDSEKAGVRVELEKQVDGEWRHVSALAVEEIEYAEWVYMAVPEQESDREYRIHVYNTDGEAAWYFKQGDNEEGALSNGKALNGSFVYRVIQNGLTEAVKQTSFDTSDKEHQLLGQTFISDVPFNRVSIMIDTPSNGNYEYSISLYKKVDGQWKERTKQQYQSVPGKLNKSSKVNSEPSEIVLSFSTEQPGEYKVQLSNNRGAIGWMRDSKAQAEPGFEAWRGEQQEAGQRWFKVYRGQYSIVVPELQIDVNVPAGGSYTISNLEPIITPDPPQNIPEPLTEGATLGQSFTAEERFNTVIISTPTWTNKDSAYTATLKKDGPEGEIIFTARVENAVDGNDYLQAGAQEPGVYYIEISDPYKSVGWWTRDDIYPDGHAFVQGHPILDQDRVMEIRWMD